MHPAPPAHPSTPFATRAQVAVRIRPLVGNETVDSPLPIKGNTFFANERRYTFDGIFPADTTQEDFYNSMVKPLVFSAVDGFNVSILAYGQTGAGKTHTMGFSPAANVQDRGIADRFFDDLFKLLSADPLRTATVHASHVEFDGERLTDLLDGRRQLSVREGDGNFYIKDLSQIEVKSADATTQLLREGCSRRKTAETSANVLSSRTHSIFAVQIEISNPQSTVFAKVSLVDLAGCERSETTEGKRSGVEAKRFHEGVNINKGLTTLGYILTALAQPRRVGVKPPHIPYRNSKLTSVLKPNLDGTSRSVFIACVSPASCHRTATDRTVEYVSRARKIKLKPKPSVVERVASQQAQHEQLETAQKKIETLQSELEDTRVELGRTAEELKRSHAEVAASYFEYEGDLQVLQERNARLEAERNVSEQGRLVSEHLAATERELAGMLAEDLLATCFREQRRRSLADLVDMLEDFSAFGLGSERGTSETEMMYRQPLVGAILESLEAYVSCGGNQHDVASLRHEKALRLCLELTKP